MSRQKLTESKDLLPEQLDTELWPTVDVFKLSEVDQLIFESRKNAVELYFENMHTMAEIAEITSIQPRKLRRFVRRCLQLDTYGVPWGFRALIPHKNINAYRKLVSAKGFQSESMTGELTLLFNKYPNIKERVDHLYLGRLSREAKDPIMRPKNIHGHFIEECRKSSIKMNEYPFNTQYLGYRSLTTYLQELKNTHFGKASERYGKDAAQKAQNAGVAEQNYPIIIRPYQWVQFDAHRLDAVFAIMIETLEGDIVIRILERIWLLAVIDVATRNVLGHYISFEKEYNAADVMTCFKNAIVPHQRRTITIPGLAYQATAGFPSEQFKESEWAVWEAISLDNAKSNLSKLVSDRLQNLIGCAVNPGPVGKPIRRPHIERFFQTLEENGFHRLPYTTGSHFKDPRRDDPDKKAIQYYITLEHLEDIIELLIANYNGTPHHGVHYLSPLEAMQQRLGRGMLPTKLSEDKRSELAFLQINTTRTVRGDIKTGKRPYIYYEGVEYRNDILVHAGELIGTELSLRVNVDDVRFLKAFLPDGSELGTLIATGNWSWKAHSLKVRKEIMKLKRNRFIHFTIYDCPVTSYQLYLEQNSSKKRNVNKAVQVKRAIDGARTDQSSKNTEEKDKRVDKIQNTTRSRSTRKLPEFKTITF